MLGLPNYLYRLIPANPILLRVVAVGGKRKRDLFVRCGYLALLIILVVIGVFSNAGDIAGTDLDDLSRSSVSIFKMLSYLQLALVALMAPVFTAGAITQEKDSQTYDILLTTPLSNGQIVLGTLLSRLFFVFALLLSGIPVFSITQIFGGVAIGDIVTSFGIAAATALVCGALAVGIATFKIGTRRTIFSFFMFVAIYMVGGLLLDRLAFFRPDIIEADGTIAAAQTSWLTGLHPFLALATVLEPDSYQPPTLAQLPAALRWWPVSWYLTQPVAFFITFMFVLSSTIVLPGIALLRRVAQSTGSVGGWFAKKLRVDGLKRDREPRRVWSNPIAWREAKTKASAAKASITRYGFILLGLAGAIILAVLYASEASTPGAYITANSYNPTNRTIALYGVEAGRYGIVPNANITLDQEPLAIDYLRGRYEVIGTNFVDRADGTKAIASLSLGEIQRTVSRTQVRQFLLGAVFLETVVILLIVTNAAASTVTREKEDGTLDLLLSTPITSKYYIWGKLRGLVSYVLPLVAVPAASVLIFVIYDVMATLTGNATREWTVFPEAVLLLPAMLVIMTAFASIVGMQMSLRLKTTVRSTLASIAIVLGVIGLLGFCGVTLVDNGGSGNPIPYAIAAFSPFTTMAVLIAPLSYGGPTFGAGDPSEIMLVRVVVILFTLVAVSAYTAVVWGMYRSMVKNFDMTIRRQHR
ncbi:MAG: ABC-2 transporter permease [Planctomycetota bacterium]